MRQLTALTGLALLASTAVTIGCGGDDPVDPDPTVASVDVLPASSTLAALGETTSVQATARDGTGAIISGKTFTWSSSDPAVATVVSTSANTAEVSALQNGTVTITATADQVSGDAAVIVSQIVTMVEISPSSHRLESQGATVQLVATGRDALGTDVPGATFVWQSSDVSLATVDGSGVVTAVAYGSATITATADGASDDATIDLGLEIPTDGLLAAWLFNGNANDESGNGNDGAVSGSILAPDRHGNADRAYSFDGVDDRINIGNDVKPPFPMSISAWLNVMQPGTVGGIFRNDIWDPNGFYHGIYVVISLDEGIGVGQGSGFASASTRSQFAAAPGALTAGNWHHIAVVFEGFDQPRFYVDNVEFPIDQTGGSGTTMTYSTNPGFIGHRVEYFDGLIDDVRVYARVLTGDDVEALFFEGRLKP